MRVVTTHMLNMGHKSCNLWCRGGQGAALIFATACSCPWLAKTAWKGFHLAHAAPPPHNEELTGNVVKPCIDIGLQLFCLACILWCSRLETFFWVSYAYGAFGFTLWSAQFGFTVGNPQTWFVDSCPCMSSATPQATQGVFRMHFCTLTKVA